MSDRTLWGVILWSVYVITNVLTFVLDSPIPIGIGLGFSVGMTIGTLLALRNRR